MATKLRAARFLVYSAAELKENHQVYVIAPLIEESENSDLTNVCELRDKMKLAFGEHYKIDIVHGKMSSGAKDLIMDQFKKNEVQILISIPIKKNQN
mgnify:CR=1 FL=1